jgi:hypothetical protein
MQERGAERLGVEPHPGANLSDPDRVGDELISRTAHLIAMAVAGEVEGVSQRGAIDFGRRVELLDHGEEVGEELALL